MFGVAWVFMIRLHWGTSSLLNTNVGSLNSETMGIRRTLHQPLHSLGFFFFLTHLGMNTGKGKKNSLQLQKTRWEDSKHSELMGNDHSWPPSLSSRGPGLFADITREIRQFLPCFQVKRARLELFRCYWVPNKHKTKCLALWGSETADMASAAAKRNKEENLHKLTAKQEITQGCCQRQT